MPELPEVETMRRGIAATVGCRIESVERPRCRLKPILISPKMPQLRRRIVGTEVTASDRIGKRVLLRLDSDDVLVFEPRMTGLVLLTNPPNRQHLRLQLNLAAAAARNGRQTRRSHQLSYWDRRGLGSVRLLAPPQLEEMASKFGPDALQTTAETLRERLGRSQRAIKVALLDQHAVAGIGNLYASEILHLARIHPQSRCNHLRRPDWQRIASATREVLEAAVRYEGSTLSDGTYRNALNEQGGYQNYHRVYDRAGVLCPACGKAKIQRIVQSQRSTFFCHVCQRERRPSR
jgi:formamidopyrimidine-DNA glycosylase